jgi:hypothetical protein
MVRDLSTVARDHRRIQKSRLPPVVDLAFVARVSHYGNGSKRAAAGEAQIKGEK